MFLSEKIALLPTNPGVYIMKNNVEQVIYIGKAKNLKNRVKQYFSNSKKQYKVQKMVDNIADFEYIITANDLEALILENNLIKKHKPPYNILLKDDKTYPYIKINKSTKYPKIEFSRGIYPDGAQYFGPYMLNRRASDIIELLCSLFKLRDCNIDFNKINKPRRPCLSYDMGRCMAPCAFLCAEEDYNLAINRAIDFLEGRTSYAKKYLNKKIKAASDKLQFEVALDYKKQLDQVDKININQSINLSEKINYDVISIVSNDYCTVVYLLFVRNGCLIGEDKMVLNDFNVNIQDALYEFLLSFYTSKMSVPNNILINIDFEDKENFIEYLKQEFSLSISVVKPTKGVKKSLIDMANVNAFEYLLKYSKESIKLNEDKMDALNSLYNNLNLNKVPLRIECFDISHISGTNKVASMTVLTNGQKDQKAYRRFRIKTVEGNNDFACMAEVLRRRFKAMLNSENSFIEKPDLVVVDGGFIQLDYAQKVFEELGIDNIDLIGLAEKEELVALTSSKEFVKLDKRDSGLKLLQMVRDEAHRFAITYHRRLRNDAMLGSVLLNIEGIGPKKILNLYNKFKTVDNIKNATKSELITVANISKKDAENIIEYFLSE